MGLFFKSKAEIAGRKNCKTKVRYSNETAAKAALEKINPRHAKNKPYRIYKCPHCSGFHLSSQPAR